MAALQAGEPPRRQPKYLDGARNRPIPDGTPRPALPESVQRRVVTERPVTAPVPVLATSISGAATAPGTPPLRPRIVPRKKRRWKPWVFGGLAIVLLGVAIYFGIKLILATNHIISRNFGGGAPSLAGDVDPTKLRGEGDGRINILLLGIGGPGHEAPNLSDTIMVVSIDPKTKDVAMLSIPRDLWVPIPGFGNAKINAAHSYGESEKYPGGGPALAKETVSKVLDLPIHYYIRMDFAGFRQAIDTVGGVDVTVDKALNDPFFPCDSENGKYCPFTIKPGLQHMNGTTALKYARSRETTSDFDRAARQQKVLVALRTKVLSVPTLANPAKISSLIDAVGNHAKTDLQLYEMKKLMDIVKVVEPSRIINKVLSTAPDNYLVDGNIGGGYVELPKSGNFNDIREFVHSIFTDSYLRSENAKIEVQNGTTTNGLAAAVTKQLKAYNYNIINTTTADKQTYTKTVIYDYSNGKKPYTISYLEKRFNVKAIKTTLPSPSPAASPAAATSPTVTPEIRIIIGTDYVLPVSTGSP